MIGSCFFFISVFFFILSGGGGGGLTHFHSLTGGEAPSKEGFSFTLVSGLYSRDLLREIGRDVLAPRSHIALPDLLIHAAGLFAHLLNHTTGEAVPHPKP